MIFSEFEGAEKMRDLFMFEQDGHKVFYVEIGNLLPEEAAILVNGVKVKYNTDQVAGFTVQENGEWLINPY